MLGVLPDVAAPSPSAFGEDEEEREAAERRREQEVSEEGKMLGGESMSLLLNQLSADSCISDACPIEQQEATASPAALRLWLDMARKALGLREWEVCARLLLEGGVVPSSRAVRRRDRKDSCDDAHMVVGMFISVCVTHSQHPPPPSATTK